MVLSSKPLLLLVILLAGKVYGSPLPIPDHTKITREMRELLFSHPVSSELREAISLDENEDPKVFEEASAIFQTTGRSSRSLDEDEQDKQMAFALASAAVASIQYEDKQRSNGRPIYGLRRTNQNYYQLDGNSMRQTIQLATKILECHVGMLTPFIKRCAKRESTALQSESLISEKVASDLTCEKQSRSQGNCPSCPVTGVSSEFTSPNYPSDYGGPWDCYYLLSAQQGEKITVEFTELFVERIYDFLVICDGDTQGCDDMIRNVSGYTPPLKATSKLNQMVIRFSSDESNDALPNGATAKWKLQITASEPPPRPTTTTTTSTTPRPRTTSTTTTTTPATTTTTTTETTTTTTIQDTTTTAGSGDTTTTVVSGETTTTAAPGETTTTSAPGETTTTAAPGETTTTASPGETTTTAAPGETTTTTAPGETTTTAAPGETTTTAAPGETTTTAAPGETTTTAAPGETTTTAGPGTESTTTGAQSILPSCTYTSGCESSCLDVTSSGGSVFSSNYPNDNADNLNCNIVIQVPNGAMIKLNFIDFHVEEDYDFVTIYEGASTSNDKMLREPLSGYELPVAFNVKANMVTINVQTDENNWGIPGYENGQDGRWKLNFEVVYPSTTTVTTDSAISTTSEQPISLPPGLDYFLSSSCDGGLEVFSGLSSTGGSIHMPKLSLGSGASYGNNVNCDIIINANSRARIELVFSEFNVEQDYDFVSIYDSDDKLFRKETGYSVPDTTIIKSTSLRINFKTDANNLGIFSNKVGTWAATFTIKRSSSIGRELERPPYPLFRRSKSVFAS